MNTVLNNEKYKIKISNGCVTEIYSDIFGPDNNLSFIGGKTGTACFTLTSDDITSLPHDKFTPYNDRTCTYNIINQETENSVTLQDTSNDILTEIRLQNDGIKISSSTSNKYISEFGINLELNFLGRKGSDFKKQLLATSPYTSADGKYMFYILTNPDGNFLIITAETPCDGWKIDYSPQCFAHNIINLKFLASFDKVYNGSGRKNLEISLHFSSSLDEAFDIISNVYGIPVCRPVINGGFDNSGKVKVHGEYDFLTVTSPSEQTIRTDDNSITMNEYGFHTITPVFNDKQGIECVLWNGNSITKLFDKSCDSIKKPYHPDDNLCEGGCFLWALLANMNFNAHFKYEKILKEELDIILGKGEYVHRKTIVPHKTENFDAYHIHNSTRVQEQFFGVSILLEAYKLYNTEELYEFMIATLNDLALNYIKDGMVYNGSDYTTVCAPIIPLIDVTLLLRSKNDERYKFFMNTARDMANYLYNRRYNFPTEGEKCDLYNKEYEDGSISCTALSLLYYCRYIERNEKYESFAYEVLDLHKAWTCYSPDAKINGSSFRWWETIWEGDGEGPALCCGHAWTIWKGEALFHGGIISRNDSMLLASWNAYITNFCKTQKDGTMYSCYEADYIRGGGDLETKQSLKQLKGERLDIKYKIAHSYPSHPDNSLSRYAWVRAYYTWLNTAAILNIDGEIIPVNAKIENNIIKTTPNITKIYITAGSFELENKNLIIL